MKKAKIKWQKLANKVSMFSKRHKVLSKVAFIILPTSIAIGTLSPLISQIHQAEIDAKLNKWTGTVNNLNELASLYSYAEETDNQSLLNELQNEFSFNNLTLSTSINNLDFLQYLETNNNNGFAVQIPNAEIANPNSVYSFSVSLSQINTSAQEQLPPSLQGQFLCLNSNLQDNVILLIPETNYNFYFSNGNTISNNATQVTLTSNGYPFLCYAVTISLSAIQTIQQNYLTIGSYNPQLNNSVNLYDTVQLANIANNFTLSNDNGTYGWKADTNGYVVSNNSQGDNAVTLNYDLGSLQLNSNTIGELGFLKGLDPTGGFAKVGLGNNVLQNLFNTSYPSYYNNSTKSSLYLPTSQDTQNNYQVGFNAPVYYQPSSLGSYTNNDSDFQPSGSKDTYSLNQNPNSSNSSNDFPITDWSDLSGNGAGITTASNYGLDGAGTGVTSTWSSGSNPGYNYAQWLINHGGNNEGNVQNVYTNDEVSGAGDNKKWYNSNSNDVWTSNASIQASSSVTDIQSLNSFNKFTQSIQLNPDLQALMAAQVVALKALYELYQAGKRMIPAGKLTRALAKAWMADPLTEAVGVAQNVLGWLTQIGGYFAKGSAIVGIPTVMALVHAAFQTEVQYALISSGYDGTMSQAVGTLTSGQTEFDFLLQALGQGNPLISWLEKVTDFTGKTPAYQTLNSYYSALSNNQVTTNTFFAPNDSGNGYGNNSALGTSLDDVIFDAWNNTFSSNNITPVSYVVQTQYIFTLNFINKNYTENNNDYNNLYTNSVIIGSTYANSKSSSSNQSVSEIAWNSNLDLSDSATNLSNNNFTWVNTNNYPDVVDLTPFVSSGTPTASANMSYYIDPSEFNDYLQSQGSFNVIKDIVPQSYDTLSSSSTIQNSTTTYNEKLTINGIGFLGNSASSASSNIQNATFGQVQTWYETIYNLASAYLNSISSGSTETFKSASNTQKSDDKLESFTDFLTSDQQQTNINNAITQYINKHPKILSTLGLSSTSVLNSSVCTYIEKLFTAYQTSHASNSNPLFVTATISELVSFLPSFGSYTTTYGSIPGSSNIWYNNIFNPLYWSNKNNNLNVKYMQTASLLESLLKDFMNIPGVTKSKTNSNEIATSSVSVIVKYLEKADGYLQNAKNQTLANDPNFTSNLTSFITNLLSNQQTISVLTQINEAKSNAYSSLDSLTITDISNYLTFIYDDCNGKTTIAQDYSGYTATSSYNDLLNDKNITQAQKELYETNYDTLQSTLSALTNIAHYTLTQTSKVSGKTQTVQVWQNIQNMFASNTLYFVNILFGFDISTDGKSSSVYESYNATSSTTPISSDTFTSPFTSSSQSNIDYSTWQSNIINALSKTSSSNIINDLFNDSDNSNNVKNLKNWYTKQLTDFLNTANSNNPNSASLSTQTTYTTNNVSLSDIFTSGANTNVPENSFESTTIGPTPASKSSSSPASKSSSSSSDASSLPTYIDPFGINFTATTYNSITISTSIIQTTTTSTSHPYTPNTSVTQNISDFNSGQANGINANTILQAPTISTTPSNFVNNLDVYLQTGASTNDSADNYYNDNNGNLTNAQLKNLDNFTNQASANIYNFAIYTNPKTSVQTPSTSANTLATLYVASQGDYGNSFELVSNLYNSIFSNWNTSNLSVATVNSSYSNNYGSQIALTTSKTDSDLKEIPSISNITLYFALGSNAPIILNRSTGSGTFSPTLESAISGSSGLYNALLSGLNISNENNTLSPLYIQTMNVANSIMDTTSSTELKSFGNASGFLNVNAYLGGMAQETESSAVFKGSVYDSNALYTTSLMTMNLLANNLSAGQNSQNLAILNFGANTYNNYNAMVVGIGNMGKVTVSSNLTSSNSLYASLNDINTSITNHQINTKFWLDAYNTTSDTKSDKTSSTTSELATTPKTTSYNYMPAYTSNVGNNFNWCYNQYYTYNNANVGTMTDAINLHPVSNGVTQASNNSTTFSTSTPSEATNWYDVNTLYVTNVAGNIHSMLSSLNNISLSFSFPSGITPFSNLGDNNDIDAVSYSDYITSILLPYLTASSEGKLNSYTNGSNYVLTSTYQTSTTWSSGNTMHYIYNSSQLAKSGTSKDVSTSYPLVAYAPQLSLSNVLSAISINHKSTISLYDTTASDTNIDVGLNSAIKNILNEKTNSNLSKQTQSNSSQYSTIYNNAEPIASDSSITSLLQSNPYFNKNSNWLPYIQSALISFIANNKIYVQGFEDSTLNANGTFNSYDIKPQNTNPESLTFSSDLSNYTYVPVKATITTISQLLDTAFTSSSSTTLISGQALFNDLLAKNFSSALQFITNNPFYVNLQYTTGLYNKNEIIPDSLTESSASTFTNGSATNSSSSSYVIGANAVSSYLVGISNNANTSTSYGFINNMTHNFNNLSGYINDALVDGNNILSTGTTSSSISSIYDTSTMTSVPSNIQFVSNGNLPWGMLGLMRGNADTLIDDTSSETWTTNTVLGADFSNNIPINQSFNLSDLIYYKGNPISSTLTTNDTLNSINNIINFLALYNSTPSSKSTSSFNANSGFVPLNVLDLGNSTLNSSSSNQTYNLSSDAQNYILNNTQYAFNTEINDLYTTLQKIPTLKNTLIESLNSSNGDVLSTSTTSSSSADTKAITLPFTYNNLTSILSVALQYLNYELRQSFSSSTTSYNNQTITTYNLNNTSDSASVLSSFINSFPLLSSYIAQLFTVYNPAISINTIAQNTKKTANNTSLTSSFATILQDIISKNIINENIVNNVLLALNGTNKGIVLNLTDTKQTTKSSKTSSTSSKTSTTISLSSDPSKTPTSTPTTPSVNGDQNVWSYIYNQVVLPMNYNTAEIDYSNATNSTATSTLTSGSSTNTSSTAYIPTLYAINHHYNAYASYTLQLQLTAQDIKIRDAYTQLESYLDPNASSYAIPSWYYFNNVFNFTNNENNNGSINGNGLSMQVTNSTISYNKSTITLPAYSYIDSVGNDASTLASDVFNANVMNFSLLSSNTLTINNSSLPQVFNGYTQTSSNSSSIQLSAPIEMINLNADMQTPYTYSNNWLLNSLDTLINDMAGVSSSNSSTLSELNSDVSASLNEVLTNIVKGNDSTTQTNISNDITTLTRQNSVLGWLKAFSSNTAILNVWNSTQAFSTQASTGVTLSLLTNNSTSSSSYSLSSSNDITETFSIKKQKVNDETTPYNTSFYTPTSITLSSNNLNSQSAWENTSNNTGYLVSARILSNLVSNVIYQLVANAYNQNSLPTILASNSKALQTIFSAIPLLSLNAVISNNTLNSQLSTFASTNTLNVSNTTVINNALNIILNDLFIYGLINNQNPTVNTVYNNTNISTTTSSSNFLPIRNVIQFNNATNDKTTLTPQKALSSIEGSVAYNNLYGAYSIPKSLNANNNLYNLQNYFDSMTAWYSNINPFMQVYANSFTNIFNTHTNGSLLFPTTSNGIEASSIASDYKSGGLGLISSNVSSSNSNEYNYLQSTQIIKNALYWKQVNDSSYTNNYLATNLISMSTYNNAYVWSPLSFINMDNSWNLGINYTSYEKNYALAEPKSADTLSSSINVLSATDDTLSNSLTQNTLPNTTNNPSNIDFSNVSWLSVTDDFPSQNTTLATLNSAFNSSSNTYYTYDDLSKLLGEVIVNFNPGQSSTQGLLFNIDDTSYYAQNITINTYTTNNSLLNINNELNSSMPSDITLQNSSAYSIANNGNYFYLTKSQDNTNNSPYSINFIYNTQTSNVAIYLSVNNSLNLYNSNLANVTTNKLDSIFSYFNNNSASILSTLSSFVQETNNYVPYTSVSDNYNGSTLALGLLNFNNYNNDNVYSFGSVLNNNDDTFSLSNSLTPQQMIANITNKLLYNFGNSNSYTINTYNANNNGYYGYFEITANQNTMFYNQLQNLYNDVLKQYFNINDASYVQLNSSVQSIADSFFNPNIDASGNGLYTYNGNFIHTGVLNNGQWAVIKTKQANGQDTYSIVWNLKDYLVPLSVWNNMKNGSDVLNNNLGYLGLLVIPALLLVLLGWYIYRRRKANNIKTKANLETDTFSAIRTGYDYSVLADGQKMQEDAKNEANETNEINRINNDKNNNFNDDYYLQPKKQAKTQHTKNTQSNKETNNKPKQTSKAHSISDEEWD